MAFKMYMYLHLPVSLTANQKVHVHHHVFIYNKAQHEMWMLRWLFMGGEL